MIFKQNLYPEWKQLAEVTRDHPYGKSYSHEELAAIMQVQPNSPRYYALIRRWKRFMLKKCRRYVEVQQGVGYRLVEPNHYAAAMHKWVNRAGRRLKTAVAIGVATPTEMLTAEENLRLTNTLAKHGSLLSMFRSVQHQTRPSLLITSLPDNPKMLRKP